jgi:hypothetical protein
MADDQVNQVNQETIPGNIPQETTPPVEHTEEETVERQEEEQEENASESSSEAPIVELMDRIPAIPSPTLVVLQTLGLQAFLWLQILYQFLQYVSSKTVVISKSVVRGIQPKIFVFFQGSMYPYRLQDVTLAGPGVAPVEWFYDADNKLFLDSKVYNTTNEYHAKHFEWLSGEIKYNNITLYDISDFLEDIKWTGTTKPTVNHVLAAWSLHSGIVLNGKEGLYLYTINENGNESSVAFTA